MNEASAGLLITVEMLAMTIASVLMARFITRDRAQFFALGGMGLSVLGSIGTLAFNQEIALFAMRAIVGFGLGATIMVSNIVAANFPDPDKTFARVGLINLAFGALAVGAYSQLQSIQPQASPFLFLLMTIVLMFPLMALLPKFDMFDHAGLEAVNDRSSADLASMRMRTILLAIVTFAIVVASGIIWALYSAIGQRAGLTLHEVNDAIAVSIGSGFVGMLLPALLGGRVGRCIPLCAALITLAGAILVLTGGPTPSAFRIAVCFNVSAIYFVMPYLSGAAAAIDGGGKAAAYIGSSFFFGNAVSPFIAGVLTSTVGIHFLGVLTVLIVIVSAVAFIYVERFNKGGHAPSDTVASIAEAEYRAVEIITHG